MKKYFISACLCSLLVLIQSQPLFCQKNESGSDTLRKEAIKIFLECESCDMNYTREQIPYVNFVRDIKEAQVYILINELNAGSGGSQFTFTFKGIDKFMGMKDTLVYTSNPDETSAIIRQKQTTMLQMGLMKYVARTPVFSEIEFNYKAGQLKEEVVDKWNNWVFEISTEPLYKSEESDKELTLDNKFSVTKITEDIKLEIKLKQSYTNRNLIDKKGKKATYVSNEYEGENLFVKSLGNHLSAGLKLNLLYSTIENYDLKAEILPSIEYNLFPYSEATYRQLRLLYSVGPRYNNYIDSTLFNKINERLFTQQLNIAFDVQKQWGSISLSLLGSNYLHDFSKNRLELNTTMNLRIFKGLSLQVNGSYTYLNDQINLSKGDVSDADQMLELKELATSFKFEGGIGLVYTFGSIYNNIVNPRFGFNATKTSNSTKSK